MKRILQFAVFAVGLVILVLLTPSCGGGSAGDGGGAIEDGAAAAVDQGEPAAAPERTDVAVTDDSVPDIHPARFSTRVDNPLLPLEPGTKFTYEGDTDEGRVLTEVLVTDRTEVVMGVTCRVVEVVEHLDGELAEVSALCYAQDEKGVVWFFSEEAHQIENGQVVGTEGSFTAGQEGAQPGIAMPGDPKPGDVWRTEYSPGRSEDLSQVIGRNILIVLPGGAVVSCLLVREWDLLDEEADEHKYYAPGVGVVRMAEPDGSNAVDLTKVETN